MRAEKVFEPRMKTLLDPLALAYKKRVYSSLQNPASDEKGRLRPKW